MTVCVYVCERVCVRLWECVRRRTRFVPTGRPRGPGGRRRWHWVWVDRRAAPASVPVPFAPEWGGGSLGVWAGLCLLFLLGNECWPPLPRRQPWKNSTSVCPHLSVCDLGLVLAWASVSFPECRVLVCCHFCFDGDGVHMMVKCLGKWHPNERDRASNVRPWNRYQNSSWRRRCLGVYKIYEAEVFKEKTWLEWWDSSKRDFWKISFCFCIWMKCWKASCFAPHLHLHRQRSIYA